MPVNVREADRDQLYLLPPSVADWLPEGHLAWFVLDVVGELDLSAFYAAYRDDGRGGAQLSTVGSSSSGLAGLTERVRAVDGQLDLVSPPGGPTVVTVDLPLSP